VEIGQPGKKRKVAAGFSARGKERVRRLQQTDTTRINPRKEGEGEEKESCRSRPSEKKKGGKEKFMPLPRCARDKAQVRGKKRKRVRSALYAGHKKKGRDTITLFMSVPEEGRSPPRRTKKKKGGEKAGLRKSSHTPNNLSRHLTGERRASLQREKSKNLRPAICAGRGIIACVEVTGGREENPVRDESRRGKGPTLVLRRQEGEMLPSASKEGKKKKEGTLGGVL